MGQLILKRVGTLIPVLFGVTFLSFLIINILPGNVALQILGDNSAPGALAALEKRLGLNQSIPVRYWHWIDGVIHGNLGNSMATNQPVTHAIWAATPPTLELIIYAEIVGLILTMFFAFLSVWTRSRLLDRFITVVALAGISVPGFVIGIIMLLIFAVKLHLVASISYTPLSMGIAKNLEAMALPAVTLGLSLFPTQMRVLRGDMLEQLDNEDYVSLARIKGLSKAGVILKHVFRNSATSFITLLSLQLGVLIGGAVIVEQVFTINGIGALLIAGIFNHDATMVEGIILIIGTAVVTMNLVADILYMLLDPRIRYD